MLSYFVKRRVKSQWIDEAYIVCLLAGYACSLLAIQFFPTEARLLVAILLGEALCLVFFLLFGAVISLVPQDED